MNVLDENIMEDQRQMLRAWRIPVRQIGGDLWHKGLQDDEIPRYLQQLHRPTFLTRDLGFHDQRLCHEAYSIVVFSVGAREVASFVRRFLHHPGFANQRSRMGTVSLVSHGKIRVWRRNAASEQVYVWPL